MEIKDFKLRKLELPKGMTDAEINRTPLSQYRRWDTAQGVQLHGGTFYDSSKQSILAQITSMLLNGRKHDKQKMKILEQHAQGITVLEEISKKAEIDMDTLKERLAELEVEQRGHAYYSNTQHIKKIRANSLYGALGNPYFHLYNLKNAINVTLSGQELIKYLSDTFNDFFKDEFYKDKRYFPETNEINRCTKNVVCLIDTDSVTGDTLVPIIVAGDKTGRVQNKKIEDVMKMVRPMGTAVETLNFEKYEVGGSSNTESMFTYSMNMETGAKELKPIKHIFRHIVEKEMFEIRVKDKKVKVTADHSIIINRDGKFMSVKPAQIKSTDELMHVK